MATHELPRAGAFACLAVAAGFLWAPKLDQKQPGLSSAAAVFPAIPVQVGQWQGRALAVGDRVIEILETDAVSLMEYKRAAGHPVWLAYVAGFGNRAAFHPPEICYVGSHYEVLERGPITISINGQSQQLMRLVIGQDKARYEAWYWFTANDRVTPSYYQQQWWLLLGTIKGSHSSGTLVRISTLLDDSQATHERLLDFAANWNAATKKAAVL